MFMRMGRGVTQVGLCTCVCIYGCMCACECLYICFCRLPFLLSIEEASDWKAKPLHQWLRHDKSLLHLLYMFHIKKLNILIILCVYLSFSELRSFYNPKSDWKRKFWEGKCISFCSIVNCICNFSLFHCELYTHFLCSYVNCRCIFFVLLWILHAFSLCSTVNCTCIFSLFYCEL